MNLQGDFDYANPEETASFGGSLEARRAEFAPDGALGKALRKRHQAVALVEASPGSGNGILYSHGSLLPGIAQQFDVKGQDAVKALNHQAAWLFQGDSTSLVQSESG